MSRFPKTGFALKCILVSGLIMFASMAVGEIFVDPNLFRGFLGKPQIWYALFIESSIAVLPVCLIGMLILRFVRPKSKEGFLLISSGVWISLGLSILLLYKAFYFPREWRLTLPGPGILFGWVIPCSLILICMIWFSRKLYVCDRMASER